MANSDERVVPLDELPDYRVASDDPDVRGWDVIASDGARIGAVDTLLVDPGAMKVRYLDVGLSEGAGGTAGADPHILIPIGYARVDEGDRRVRVDALHSAEIRALPVYSRDLILSEYEATLRQRLGTRPPEEARRGTTASDDAERLTLSEEELHVGKREVPAGEVRVEKHVDVEHVRESVPVRHDEVIVERHPATPGMAAEPRIGGEEIHVPVHREELVVGKRVVPKEEIVVRTRETIDTETVEADLRRERVEVDRKTRNDGEGR